LFLFGKEHSGKKTFLSSFHKATKREQEHSITISGNVIRSAKYLSRILYKQHYKKIYLENIDRLNESTLLFFLKWMKTHSKVQITASTESELSSPIYDRLESIHDSSHFIYFPPLNKSPDDLLLLAMFFIEQLNMLFEKDDLHESLTNYRWPKGIHQLKYTLMYAAYDTLVDKQKKINKVHIDKAIEETYDHLDLFEILESINLNYLSYLAQKHGHKKIMDFTESILLERMSLLCQGCSSQAASMLLLPLSTYMSKKNYVEKCANISH
jgi:transcriptional regulator of acetoin/glycerol metabolism